MSKAERLLGDPVRPALSPKPQRPAVGHQVRRRFSQITAQPSDRFELVLPLFARRIIPRLPLSLCRQCGEVSVHGFEDEATLDCLQQQAARRGQPGNHLQEWRR